MLAPVIEVLTLTLKAGAAADEPVKALFRVLEKQKGYQGGHWGRWEELEDKIQLFIQWDKHSSKKAFKTGPDAAAGYAAIRPIIAGPPAVHHVYFTHTLPSVLSAPVTEITTFYSLTETFEDDAEGFLSILDGVKGCLGIAKVPVIEELGEEKVKAYQVLIGWENVKAHEEAMMKTEVMAKVGLAIKAAKKVEMHHVKLIAA